MFSCQLELREQILYVFLLLLINTHRGTPVEDTAKWWFNILILTWELMWSARRLVLPSIYGNLTDGHFKSMVPFQLAQLWSLKHTNTPIKMLLWHGVILFSMANTVVIHFLWLYCSTVVRMCFVFQSIVCTGMMKWYPDPQHIHCIQSCEVRAQTAKQPWFKYRSMMKMLFIPKSVSPRPSVKWGNVYFSHGCIWPRTRKLLTFVLVFSLFYMSQIWHSYCGKKRKTQVLAMVMAACNFCNLHLMVSMIYSCPLVSIQADSTSV